VYDDDSEQKDVYDETAFPLVKSVMEGYNGTIFGQMAGASVPAAVLCIESMRDVEAHSLLFLHLPLPCAAAYGQTGCG
jgi:hypothetical protein